MGAGKIIAGIAIVIILVVVGASFYPLFKGTIENSDNNDIFTDDDIEGILEGYGIDDEKETETVMIKVKTIIERYNRGKETTYSDIDKLASQVNISNDYYCLLHGYDKSLFDSFPSTGSRPIMN